MLKNNSSDRNKKINSLSNTKVNILFNKSTNGLTKNLKNGITNKRNYIKQSYKNKSLDIFYSDYTEALTSIIVPKGYIKIDVPGDNYCFYHSIVQTVKESNIDQKFKNIFLKFKNGYTFKDDLIVKLIDTCKSTPFKQNEIKNIWLYLGYENGISNRKINNVSYDVIIIDIINNLCSRLWGGGPIINLVAFLYGLCITIYNNQNDKFMETIKPFETFQSNNSNTIYLYFNGENHYDALIKTS